MCKHSKTKVVLTPELKKHYGKKVCYDCGKWISWVKDPKIDEAHLRRNNEIEYLLKNPLDNKDKSFLESIRKQRILLPKQQLWYDSILKKLNEFMIDELDITLDDWYFYTFGSHNNLSDEDRIRLKTISDKLSDGDDYSQFNY